MNNLLILVLFSSAFARLQFHSPNSFDLTGKQCNVAFQTKICPPTCVSNVNLCPDNVKPTCPINTSWCQDGTCKRSCDGVKPLCFCPNQYQNFNQFNQPSGQLYPCANLKINITGVTDTNGDQVLKNQCKKIIPGLSDVSTFDPNTPFLLECVPKSARKIEVFSIEFIFFYIFVGLQLLFLITHNLYKRFKERDFKSPSSNAKNRKIYKLNAETEVEMQDLYSKTETDNGIIFTGFKTDVFGKVVKLNLIIASFIWMALLAVLSLDYYEVFSSFTSDEAANMLFNDHDTLSRFFIVLWHIVTVWLVFLKIGESRQKTYFSIRTTLENANLILVEKKLQSPVYLAGMGLLVHKIRQFEKVFRKYCRTDVAVEVVPVKISSAGNRYIEFECVRYIFDESTKTFEENEIKLGPTFSDFHKQLNGLTINEALARYESVGPNAINFPGDTFFSGICKEFTGYFYIYQIMSLWIWYYYAYYYMGIVLTVVIVVAGITKVSVGLKAQRKVLQMAAFKGNFNVKRDNKWVSLDCSEIVPGDVIEINSGGHLLPVDVVLLKGGAVVDESSLTGEALPVAKFSCKDDKTYFERDLCKVHCMYAGCKIYQVQPPAQDEPVCAIVTETGANTLMLLLSILFLGSESVDSWFYGMFTISQVLSPLLPAVLVIGQSVASERLRKHKILCVDLQRVTLGGKVKIFCFDKTGTLTKEGLDFRGCQSIVGNEKFKDTESTFSHFNENIQEAMSVAHSLQLVDDQFVGNFVDIEMFKNTGARLEIHGPETLVIQAANKPSLRIIKRFEFVHARMYMSVLIQNRISLECKVFLKGSFEKLKDLVDPLSLPKDFEKVALHHASQGCYVLALAEKKFDKNSFSVNDLEKMDRSTLESGATFIGFMLFRNELKMDTKSSLEELKNGGCRIVMITGDNANTAIYIGRQSGFIQGVDNREEPLVILGDVQEKGIVKWKNTFDDSTVPLDMLQEYRNISHNGGRPVELAVTGKAFNALLNDGLMRNLLLDTRIFARMSPVDKTNCVRLHMEKAVTAMCGDGGNDAGALKASHCGIALSEAESSVVSHFSSSNRSIKSCVTLLLECRCSLDVSFASYKYLLMYGEIIAFIGLLQYYFTVNMSQAMWILIDGSTIPLSWALTMSKPAKTLKSTRPTARLLGVETFSSVFGQIFISLIFMVAITVILFQESWFRCNEFDGTTANIRRWWELSDNFESSVTGLLATFQIVNSAATFNIGNTYRLGFFRNLTFIFLYSNVFGFLSYITLADPNSLGELKRA
ncbi:hypothetical protein HK099_003131 [Clydaea vesicula]|uniref:P-type ATPase A domain-containing protein n=1 Tax=Clydaea vesicula TaxID=447962 RepID=A0AAD5Y3P9_9FUNG|nr:hypothetical protein HK099_003131 [Clydaea vesicula]